MARERICFKSLSIGDGFLRRKDGLIYIKVTGRRHRYNSIQITGAFPGRRLFRNPYDEVIWLGKVVDVVTKI